MAEQHPGPIPDLIAMDLLDLYEIRAVPMGMDGDHAIVCWHCHRCRLAGTTIRDMDADQTGLTLAELAETVREHETEVHSG